MCGICGYFSTSGLFSPKDLNLMSAAIAYRGPDAEGYFSDQFAGLGHRRLSIIDLSEAANQPMRSSSGRYVVSYNGEIYNFREIARELQKGDPRLTFRTSSDTEIILEAFEKWGTDSVTRFNGMFAIAIYDTRENRLYIFRDRMGEKPLYYYYDGKNLAFASELKALPKVPAINSRLRINRHSISTFLYLGYIPEPNTIFSKVFKLPTGTFLVIDKNNFDIAPYWTLEEQIKPEVISDFDTAKSIFNNLLTRSIKRQLISDVPYGIFLSGGTDSSLITAVSQRLISNDITTFTIGFKEAKYNEAPYARDIARYLNTRHHEFTVSYNDAIPLLEDILTTYDEPYADSSAIPTLLVSKLARKHVKMVLTGDGGDELFLGYGSHKWAERLSNPAMHFFRKPIAMILSSLSDRGKRASTLFEYPYMERKKSHIFSQEQYYFSESEIHHLLRGGFNTPVFADETASFLPRKLTPAEEQAFFDLHYYLRDELLVKMDRASMQFGLEARSPYLDFNLVNFALNLDPSLKIHNGTQKYLLKELLYDYVPKKYFNRPKWGFAMPLRIWLKNELKYFLDEYLSEKIVNDTGIVNYDIVGKLKKDFLNGNDILYHRLWLLIILHKYFKGNTYPAEETAQAKPAAPGIPAENTEKHNLLLQRKAEAEVKIFLFHRISPEIDPLWQPMSPSVFHKIINHLSKTHEVVPLESYLSGDFLPSAGKKLCAITFDDGYKDYLDFALPILSRYKCPSSLYVITDCITHQVPPWTYVINHLFRHTKKMKLNIHSDEMPQVLKKLMWNNAGERIQYAKWLSPYMKSLTEEKRKALFNKILEQFSDVPLPEKTMLTWDEVRQSRPYGTTIGSHTATHPILAKKLSRQTVYDEARGSMEIIEKETGTRPCSISYPFGNYNEKIKQIMKEAGYEIGLTVTPRPYNQKYFDRFEIPRIEVSQNNYPLAKLAMGGWLQNINQFR